MITNKSRIPLVLLSKPPFSRKTSEAYTEGTSSFSMLLVGNRPVTFVTGSRMGIYVNEKLQI